MQYQLYPAANTLFAKNTAAKKHDKILNIASLDDIPEIEKIVISNYKEMVLEGET